jgi:hypothetical protein
VAGETPSTTPISSTLRPPKKTQLHNPALTLVEQCQVVQRAVQRQQVGGPLFGDDERLIQRKLLLPRAPFGGMPPFGVLDENAPHQLGRDTEKMRAVPPGRLH